MDVLAYPGILVVFTFIIDPVTADDNINYIIASSTVAILFFFLCIVMACVFFNCSAIYRSFGYERIPKHELQRRKMAKIMISHHSSQQYLAPATIHTIEKDNASWVQTWREEELEERQDAVMQLGPEPEYRIETTLEDGGTSSPYHTTSLDNDGVPEGLYATVDKSGKTAASSSSANGSVLGSYIKDSTELL